MAKQIRVSRRRRSWAAPREAVIKGTPLTYPAPARLRYQAALEALIAPMRREYERELNKLLADLPTEDAALAMDANIGSAARILLNELAEKWRKRFTAQSDRIVRRMMQQVDRSSKANLSKSLKQLSGGLTIPTPEMPEALRPVISASIAENVSLIRDVSRQYHQRVESAVMVSIQTGGQGRATVLEAVRAAGEKSDRRARLIARDQTAKITAAYNAERAKSVGMKKFMWQHSGGGAEPRELHLKLSGQIFEYENPPVIDERTGERGLPGQLINCRCVAVPLLDFGDEDLTA